MDITNKTSFSNQTVCNNREIKYIVIHYTAGSSGAAGAAANIAAMFANPSTGASADYIVDSGGAVRFNPDIKNRCTWHCGGAFSVFANAKKLADEHAGYSVFDLSGKLVYSPNAKKKTVTELANEVIAGKWGNGTERKNRLTAAGYDFAAVQAEVNRLMR